MIVWRLLPRQFADAPLDGEGARLNGGRWNPPGVAMVYASTSLSLAALEILVHVGAPDLLPDDLTAVEVVVPDGASVETLPVDDLPRGWGGHPAPRSLAGLGREWVESKRTALLRVPSAVVSVEWNLLVNPVHPDAAGLRVASRRPFRWDARLSR